LKILGVDTATKSCSVGIVDKESLIAEITIAAGRTHSTHLMELIDKVIGLSGLTLHDLDGFAVTSGPGSFTGLRIGMSTVKGLAVASGKPVAGVSSLEALAMQCFFSSGLICPLLDARKGEVYSCLYRFQDGLLKREIRATVRPLGRAISDINEPCLFVGDGAFLFKKPIVDQMGRLAHFVPACQNTIRASTVAHLSMSRFENHDTEDLGMMVPHYIRKSEAELKFGKKKKSA